MSKNTKGSRKAVLHLTFPSRINGTKIQTVVASLGTAKATEPFRLVMGFLSVDTEIHINLNNCLVHGNLHWGGNTIGSNMFCSFGDVILCLLMALNLR